MAGVNHRVQRWQWRNTVSQYGWLAKGLHWVVAVMALVLLFVGFYMTGHLWADKQRVLYASHKQAGIVLLGLMALRVVNAYGFGYVRNANQRMHHLLYLLLLAMPLSGWVMSSSAGHPPVLFRLHLPLMAPGPRWLTRAASQCHWWFAWALMGGVFWHVFRLTTQWYRGLRTHKRMYF
jgi:cytochrome b561